ncbi:hypothetical protein [Comamonas sp. JC664]|uniref:hypothetical protein n=1 Tax=Comamonas sp. JC664 TaxID=2801917 RepID=UPI00174A50C2|nr:hypothetical protein [Comamonas sp. JC664]MBL0696332.1 hypothetical protein [Comamonas sp. JC664]GHG66533.1 hypothetical protein GCM10012319_08700 [Comamonas sp. KCTC 72670]
MRNPLFASVLAAGVLLLAGKAQALPDGWSTQETDNRVTLFDHNREVVWVGFLDDDGIWHESTHAPKRPSTGDKGGTLGGVHVAADHVRVNIARPVAGIVVIDATTQHVVFELMGGLEPGAAVKIPTDKLGDTVQLLATVDDRGTTLDLAFFKRMGACSNKSSWTSR